MKRADFEHVIRAAADIVQEDIVVVGSQAILAEHPDASDTLLLSRELDVYPRHHPERAIEIDGALGDGSAFDQTFGYFAHGVGPTTVVGPAGWEERLVPVRIAARRGTVVAWCIAAHDLVLAKLARGYPHDLEFAEEAIRTGIADARQLRLGVPLMPASHGVLVGERLERILKDVGR